MPQKRLQIDVIVWLSSVPNCGLKFFFAGAEGGRVRNCVNTEHALTQHSVRRKVQNVQINMQIGF